MYFWRYNIICEFELLQLVYIYKSVIYFLTFQSIELVELVAVEIVEQPQRLSTRESVCHITCTFNMIKLVTVLYLYILLTMLFSVAEESILLDLKHLLREAKQKIPPFLANMQSENEKYLDIGGKLSWQLTKKYVILIGRISRVVILDLLVVMMVSFGMCLLQARLAAPTVEDWDIVSQTVPNWRQSRQNRRRTSVAVTTWPTAVRTTE